MRNEDYGIISGAYLALDETTEDYGIIRGAYLALDETTGLWVDAYVTDVMDFRLCNPCLSP